MRRDESRPDFDHPAGQNTAGAPRVHGEVVPWEGGDLAARAGETMIDMATSSPQVVRVRRSLLVTARTPAT